MPSPFTRSIIAAILARSFSVPRTSQAHRTPSVWTIPGSMHHVPGEFNISRQLRSLNSVSVITAKILPIRRVGPDDSHVIPRYYIADAADNEHNYCHHQLLRKLGHHCTCRCSTTSRNSTICGHSTELISFVRLAVILSWSFIKSLIFMIKALLNWQ